MISVNLDKEPLVADCVQLQLDCSSLLLVSVSNGVYNNYPYYKLNCSLNGSAFNVTCNQETHAKASAMKQGQRVSLVLSLDLRYKKIKAVDIG